MLGWSSCRASSVSALIIVESLRSVVPVSHNHGGVQTKPVFKSTAPPSLVRDVQTRSKFGNRPAASFDSRKRQSGANASAARAANSVRAIRNDDRSPQAGE
jgi:hypothetical protein